jgi:type IV protein arginine methyltransferase
VVQLETYDGIFWDTFGEDYDDQREFHALVPQLLKSDGIFTFFNGLGGGNKFFNDVYCRLAELELQDLGFKVEYMTVPIDTSSSQLWDGVKRKYYSLSQYQLPLVRFAS